MSKLLPILEHFKNIVLQEQYAHVNQAVKLIRNIIEKPEYYLNNTETEHPPMLASMAAKMLLSYSSSL